jgi:hypothetical protein
MQDQPLRSALTGFASPASSGLVTRPHDVEHLFYVAVMAERVEHWFNRRYKDSRLDVYLLRTETGWQVVGRKGGAEGEQVTHYFDHEDDARNMLRQMLATAPPGMSDWAEMTQVTKHRPR